MNFLLTDSLGFEVFFSLTVKRYQQLFLLKNEIIYFITYLYYEYHYYYLKYIVIRTIQETNLILAFREKKRIPYIQHKTHIQIQKHYYKHLIISM